MIGYFPSPLVDRNHAVQVLHKHRLFLVNISRYLIQTNRNYFHRWKNKPERDCLSLVANHGEY